MKLLLSVVILLVASAALAEDPLPYITQWGGFGTGDGQFDSPAGIAVDVTGNVYVTDLNNQRIQKFTSGGAYLTQWGGREMFYFPEGVAVDASGNVFVADTYNDRIRKFTGNGAHLVTWGSCADEVDSFCHNFGVAVDANGIVYVPDTGHNGRIVKFTNDGVYLSHWQTIFFPWAITADASGNVYTTSIYLSYVAIYNGSGQLIHQWDADLLNPRGIAVDTGGNVYIADTYHHRIRKFTASGALLTEWGTFGTGDGQFRYPSGVTVDTSGNVYVTDQDNHRIQKFGWPPVAVQPTTWSNLKTLYR